MMRQERFQWRRRRGGVNTSPRVGRPSSGVPDTNQRCGLVSSAPVQVCPQRAALCSAFLPTRLLRQDQAAESAMLYISQEYRRSAQECLAKDDHSHTSASEKASISGYPKGFAGPQRSTSINPQCGRKPSSLLWTGSVFLYRIVGSH